MKIILGERIPIGIDRKIFYSIRYDIVHFLELAIYWGAFNQIKGSIKWKLG